MEAPLDLKSSLNLPRTRFPMKANLPQHEPQWLARWEELRIYDRLRQARRGRPLYLLHDGPPYANGPIHLGTAFNKCLKDFVVKSKTMAGWDAPYVPGWDCHGLPIEIKVDEALGKRKLQMAAIEVRRACRAYAEKYLDLQRQQFQRIGVFGRFDRPYSTMTGDYEAVVVASLFAFMEKGLVYKGLKPVYWCIFDKTALAEAEVEYETHTSPSIWVKYPLTSDPGRIDPRLAGKKVSTIIWTTTPWTLPASMAVAFHPDLEYVALEYGAEVYIIAALLKEAVSAKLKLSGAREIARFSGQRLEGVRFSHPFLQRSILGVLGSYVTTDQGTGAVHTAPSHGTEDFYTGARYKLDQTCNVDEAGRMHNGLPEYDGKTVFESNQPIVELLRSRGMLLAAEELAHSYPHCWRCHRPVIFRATEQWFIAMEGNLGGGATLRGRALEEIKKVRWDPAWGEERMSNMVATRPDWCISRQRVWGVPIAVFFCQGCGKLLESLPVNRAVVELFAREGADAWYLHEPEAILPAGTRCPHCSGRGFRKETDILDVWFESGSSQAAVLDHEPGLPWPADLYLEGADQFRGWFQSSLLCAVGTRGASPYRAVVTPGWTLDPQGRAMSKSRGNDVDPVDIARQLGGEVVRLWVASVDFREDVIASEELMRRVAENYRKIRNTFRFLLGNLYDFDPRKHGLPFQEMESLDQYMLVRAMEISRQARQWYEDFAFHKIYHQLHDFCVVDLSAVYLDVLKDRLYTFAPASRGRRSAQTALWRIAEALVRLVAPIMSFTAEEVWQHLPPLPGRPESVHLALFAEEREVTGGIQAGMDVETLKTDWQVLLATREEALKALEAARRDRIIGSGLEAALKISAPAATYSVLERHQAELRYLFIVSQVEIGRAAGGNGAAGIRVEVERAAGSKCERCWNYSPWVGQNASHPTICERCTAALEEIAVQ